MTLRGAAPWLLVLEAQMTPLPYATRLPSYCISRVQAWAGALPGPGPQGQALEKQFNAARVRRGTSGRGRQGRGGVRAGSRGRCAVGRMLHCNDRCAWLAEMRDGAAHVCWTPRVALNPRRARRSFPPGG